LLYILSGEDDFSLTQSLEDIKREIGDQLSLGSNITAFDGQQVTSGQLKIAGETAPFLMGRRLIIIKGLLERFEVGGRTGRRPRTSSNRSTSSTIPHQVTGSARESKQPSDEYTLWADVITRLPQTTVLILIAGKIASSNPLLKQLADKAAVKTFPLMGEGRLRQWVLKRVTEEGGAISPEAANLLVRLVGSNLWIMAGEISKLVLFTAGRCIEADDVQMVVSYAQPTNVFTMVDAIVEFKVELAEQLLEQLMQKGAHPAYLLTMLSRQVRMIVRARELRNQGKSPTEIQSKLGLVEFALRKTLEQAGRYSLARLKEVYNQLLETDLAIKTGKYDGELALNILVAELCQRGKINQARRQPAVQHA